MKIQFFSTAFRALFRNQWSMELFAKIFHGWLKSVNHPRKNLHQICLKWPYIRPWYFSLFGINAKFYEQSINLRIYPILGKKYIKTIYLDLFNTMFSLFFFFSAGANKIRLRFFKRIFCPQFLVISAFH